LKSSEEVMEILEAFDLTGSLRGAAELAGCDHKTVAHWVRARDEAGGGLPSGAGRPRAAWPAAPGAPPRRRGSAAPAAPAAAGAHRPDAGIGETAERLGSRPSARRVVKRP